MAKIKRKTQKRGRKKNYRKTRKLKKRKTRKVKRRRKSKRRKSKRRKRSRKQRGGMATLSEAYGGSNLANVSSNVTNGIEGMDNPYGVNDQPSFSSKVSGEIEKQDKANKEQVKANKATKKGQVGGMATLSEAYGGVNFQPITTGVVTGLGGAVFEGNTGKDEGVVVPQYKGASGANKNIVKAAKLGEQQKENRKYDTIQKGGGKRKYKKRKGKKKKKQKGGCGCQERF